jgi:hypothetical protein
MTIHPDLVNDTWMQIWMSRPLKAHSGQFKSKSSTMQDFPLDKP